MQEVEASEDECLLEVYGESAVAIPDGKAERRRHVTIVGLLELLRLNQWIYSVHTFIHQRIITRINILAR